MAPLLAVHLEPQAHHHLLQVAASTCSFDFTPASSSRKWPFNLDVAWVSLKRCQGGAQGVAPSCPSSQTAPARHSETAHSFRRLMEKIARAVYLQSIRKLWKLIFFELEKRAMNPGATAQSCRPVLKLPSSNRKFRRPKSVPRIPNPCSATAKLALQKKAQERKSVISTRGILLADDPFFVLWGWEVPREAEAPARHQVRGRA